VPGAKLRLKGMAANMRQKLGESLASVQKYDVPVENVTTGSLEALQAYSQGVRTTSTTGDCKTAIQQFERAISFDPNFAMAYAKLSSCYNNLGEAVKAAENARKSYELRQRVSQRERFRIEYSYEYFAIRNLEAAAQVLEAWMQAYPRDDAAPYNLANVYTLLGDHERALALKQQTLQGRRPPKSRSSSLHAAPACAWQKAIPLIKATPTALSVELCAQNTPNQPGDAIENP
jgi:Tfp pilus assembly protein PilF